MPSSDAPAGTSTGGAGDGSPRYQLLVFVEDEVRTFELPSEGAVSIGRGEGNAVRVEDASVSRQHAVLHVGPTLLIEDLGGQNGTWIRDRAAPAPSADTVDMRQVVRRKAKLQVGDGIIFGTASAVVRHAPVFEVPELADTGAPSTRTVVADPAMQHLYAEAALAARSPISVLLLGETGVGKEVLARAIHVHSRRPGPFMGINCAALTETLLESELFGYEKGAFTGAVQARAGLFESAEGGTVFLDELGELPLSTQAKLLRVLEERAVMRLGSNRQKPIDVRFIGATNRDLEAETQQGRFRSDLFFRLNGISLLIPPLRERPRDLDPLIDRYVLSASRDVEKLPPPGVSPEARELLRRYSWPGNVRELRNAIQRAVVLCSGSEIKPAHLPPAVVKAPALTPRPPASPVASTAVVTSRVVSVGGTSSLQGEIKSLERERIIETLNRFGGNQTEAARALGISRRTLVSRLDEFELPRPRKKDPR
jgi:two-component system response regulator AtoC